MVSQFHFIFLEGIHSFLISSGLLLCRCSFISEHRPFLADAHSGLSPGLCEGGCMEEIKIDCPLCCGMGIRQYSPRATYGCPTAPEAPETCCKCNGRGAIFINASENDLPEHRPSDRPQGLNSSLAEWAAVVILFAFFVWLSNKIG
jgi:hypothetical protein